LNLFVVDPAICVMSLKMSSFQIIICCLKKATSVNSHFTT